MPGGGSISGVIMRKSVKAGKPGRKSFTNRCVRRWINATWRPDDKRWCENKKSGPLPGTALQHDRGTNSAVFKPQLSQQPILSIRILARLFRSNPRTKS
jgi:hypothetical protein